MTRLASSVGQLAQQIVIENRNIYSDIEKAFIKNKTESRPFLNF